MPVLHIDQVIVNRNDFRLAKAKDAEAIARLAKHLDGVCLYEHNMVLEPGETWVSVNTLHRLGVITQVTVQC